MDSADIIEKRRNHVIFRRSAIRFFLIHSIRIHSDLIRSFLIRTFLRRPFFLAALVLAGLILFGVFPPSSDPDGQKYSAADGRHLTVSGTVTAREITARGYRLFLDHLASPESGSGSGPDSVQKTSAVFHSAVQSLNAALMPGDRMQVFLSDGRSEGDQYGETSQTDGRMTYDAKEDQTDLFESVRIGDTITLYGKCTQPEKATNPGQFDSRRYSLARRIVLKMSQPSVKELRRPEGNLIAGGYLAYRNLICNIRIGMQQGLQSVFGPEDTAQISAFILGDNSGLNSAEKRLFRDGGLSWLVCVSSLHISLLGMMLYRLLRSRGISFLLSSAGAFVVVASYALLTGFSLSAQRALVTFTIWLGSQIFGRTRDALSTLSGAACVILIRQPYALKDSAFLMSMICILSLEYLSPAAFRVFRPRYAWQKKVCSSVCLWLGSFPAVLWFFYQAAPFSSLLYPLFLPLLSILLGFGLIGCMGGGLGLMTGSAALLTIGKTCAWPCRFLLKGIRLICSLEQDLPGSVLILGRPSLWQVIVYYMVLIVGVVWVMHTKPGAFQRNCKRAAAVGWMAFLIIMIGFRAPVDFRYTCMDIGQGSCNLIENKGSVYLFDAGSSSVENVWEYRIDSTLKYYGIRRVDVVFLSHGDLDHVNGLQQILQCYHRNLAGLNAGDVTIGQILVPDLPCADERLSEILSLAGTHQIEAGSVSAGAKLEQDGMRLDILSPSADRITGDANQDCMVMLLKYHDLQILFMGDLEKEGEEMFVRAWSNSPIFCQNNWKTSGLESGNKTILIAGHHGSRNATSSGLLEMVKPDLVLISCGKNNRYGHPAGEMLERVEAAGVPYRRTDLEGAVQVRYQ